MAANTLVKRRNAQAGVNARRATYKDLRPLQGSLSRQARCVCCGEWVQAADYNPARCEPCTAAGALF